MNEKNMAHEDIIAESYRLVPIRSSDQMAVRALFEACFHGAADADWYAWKYASNPSFDGLALGMWHKGTLIAHYAGFPRELTDGFGRLTALQIGDVMIHPKARQGLAKHNRFAKLVRGYFSSKLKHGLSQDLQSLGFDLAYGFPNARHLRQGSLQDCYRPADEMFSLCLRLDRYKYTKQNTDRSPVLRWVDSASDLRACGIDVDAFNQIAQSMLKSLKPLGVWAVIRSLDYWRWRFPWHRAYRWVFIENCSTARSPIAAAVLKRVTLANTACDEPPLAYELLDWLCIETAHCVALDVLLGQLHLETTSQIQTWCTSSAAHYFSEHLVRERLPAPLNALEIDPLPFRMALSIYPDAKAATQLSKGLWMLAGDTDFR